ncbi:hypothetical protein CCACVL1_09814 [Corchorus capsularis]|uniref:DUF3527 domain-containing protein n=1 Tax=Corchorus capsularis TaxID=210143 RepID=A0A1R3IU23_COCAP|nr:hypothetical protein CCACVL1_09814 [Corchorus capsularis]
MLPQTSQRTNLQGRSKHEKPNLSSSDLHPEITKGGTDVSPESSGKHQKQHAKMKANEEEELVKYMSKLPSYLERRAKPQEKVLNVGVLEWGRLEKWQYSHKQILHRSSISSLSSSNTSSSFSTDESSAHSSGGHSCSPARQRSRRPSLQSHLISVPVEGHLSFSKPFRESVGKFQDLKVARSNTFNVQGRCIREESLSKNNAEIKLDQFKRREMYSKIDSESVTVPHGVKDKVASCDKMKMKNQFGECMKKAEKFQEVFPKGANKDVTGKRKEMYSKIGSDSVPVPHAVKDKVASCDTMKMNQVSQCMKKAEKFQEVIPKGANQDASGKRNTVVLLLPRDLPKSDQSGAASLSELTTKPCQRETETCQSNYPKTFKEAYHSEFISNVHHSGPLPCELDGGKHLRIQATGSIDANSNDLSSERSRSVPRAAKIESNSSRSGNIEERKLNSTPTKYAANEAYKGLDPKVSKPEKVRSTSPFRRFSFSISKTSRTSGSKEGSSIPQVSSTCSSGKTESEPVASSVDTSCGDKLNAKGRARSSPLRRLLDPLLKPKAVNCRNFTNQLQDSILTESACKSSEGQRHSTVTAESAKVRSDMITHSAINVNDSSQNKKYGSSAIQALLRVQVKNGLPLFTFAVDNESNILAATVKMLSSSGKSDYGCIYTFFAIQEVRKKNGRWLNQGGKGKGQDYVPNVVAQMKVSGSEISHLSRPNHVDQFSIREFVLLTLDLGQGNVQASDFQPNDEQAAIIVKIPKKNGRSSIRDGYLIDKRNHLPQAALKERLPEVKLESDSRKKCPFVDSQDFSATVILPSGIHSLPNKGEPSSLIQRWKSGGACDCGGWDLGCELRILSNRSQSNQQCSSLKSSSVSNQFELFFQGGLQDKPFFSLAPFKDGIYSVEFNSSLSLMQAFSICIAIWDSSKHYELSESVTSSEERTLGETILNDRISAPNPIEGESAARYVSYPPHSPVGRV